MRENALQAKISKKLKRAGLLVYKVEAIGQPGFPDLLVFRPGGGAVLLEVKTPTGRLRPLQVHTIERELIPQGVEVHVITNAEQALAVALGPPA